MRFFARSIACAAIVLAAACSTPLRITDESQIRVADVSFEASGRLSARYRNEGAAAGFRWTHSSDRDELLIASPLGQALARLVGTRGSVRLEYPDGRVREAGDWEALTTSALGAPLPVRGLAWWIRGSGHPSSRYAVERDDAGRASVITQDGWEIVYAYDADSRRPSRIRMSYPDTEIRIVIDDWSSLS
ncbi:MAG TPA: lipoprotein insertase outer membrane protein LolB [Casimicrobiaceae bacterium]|nr:lipoprotein insertase outer membrane protein LolB [Casimicrobiaceae bacterium]